MPSKPRKKARRYKKPRIVRRGSLRDVSERVTGSVKDCF